MPSRPLPPLRRAAPDRGAGRLAGRADPRPAPVRQDDAGPRRSASRWATPTSASTTTSRAAAAEADPVGLRRRPAGARDPRRGAASAGALHRAQGGRRPRARTPGRFLLTGSANVLLVPKLADSLAGRMEILRLHPLAQCELARRAPGFLDALFGGGFKTRRDRAARRPSSPSGSWPAAIRRRWRGRAARRRAAWYRDYIETLVQRDVRDLARISSLDALPRLLALAAGADGAAAQRDRSGRAVSAEPADDPRLRHAARAGLPAGDAAALAQQPPEPARQDAEAAPRRHRARLRAARAWTRRRSAADRALLGQLLETFVFQELRRQASWHEEPIRFHHFRDKDGVEVDIVLERGARAAGRRRGQGGSHRDRGGLPRPAQAQGSRGQALRRRRRALRRRDQRELRRRALRRADPRALGNDGRWSGEDRFVLLGLSSSLRLLLVCLETPTPGVAAQQGHRAGAGTLERIRFAHRGPAGLRAPLHFPLSCAAARLRVSSEFQTERISSSSSRSAPGPSRTRPRSWRLFSA